MKYPYICDITLKRLTMKRLRLGLWTCFCLCAATTLMGQTKRNPVRKQISCCIKLSAHSIHKRYMLAVPVCF